MVSTGLPVLHDPIPDQRRSRCIANFNLQPFLHQHFAGEDGFAEEVIS